MQRVGGGRCPCLTSGHRIPVPATSGVRPMGMDEGPYQPASGWHRLHTSSADHQSGGSMRHLDPEVDDADGTLTGRDGRSRRKQQAGSGLTGAAAAAPPRLAACSSHSPATAAAGNVAAANAPATRGVHGLLMNRRRCSRSVYMAGPTVGTKSPERCVAAGPSDRWPAPVTARVL
jgi:hypothetical protein